MKSEIFSTAIRNRYRIKFFYGINEVVIDPYFISTSTDGRKVVYGKSFGTHEIKEFEYKRIANIKVIRGIHFTPIIPIIPSIN
jgi:hypothetical protein